MVPQLSNQQILVPQFLKPVKFSPSCRLSGFCADVDMFLSKTKHITGLTAWSHSLTATSWSHHSCRNSRQRAPAGGLQYLLDQQLVPAIPSRLSAAGDTTEA